MTTADLGLFAEHFFASEAFRRGYRVSFAPGGIPGYDVILDTGRRLMRVQVKAASRRPRVKSSANYAFSLGRMAAGRNRRPITAGSCEVIAFWMDEDRCWSFKHTSEVAGQKAITIVVAATRTRARRKGRPEHEFGNWSIFGPVAQT